MAKVKKPCSKCNKGNMLNKLSQHISGLISKKNYQNVKKGN